MILKKKFRIFLVIYVETLIQYYTKYIKIKDKYIEK